MRFRRLRRRLLVQGFLSLLALIAALVLWLLVSTAGGSPPRGLGLGGATLLVAGWYFGIIRRLERRLRCPACDHSLAGFDGWALFERACPHCGSRFRADA